jgi:hypothetical protein
MISKNQESLIGTVSPPQTVPVDDESLVDLCFSEEEEPPKKRTYYDLFPLKKKMRILHIIFIQSNISTYF